MRSKKGERRGVMERLKELLNTYTSLTVIIVAALLLELMTGMMYYAAEINLQSTMEQLVKREMNAIYLCIRNKLVNVEVTLNNMSWVVSRDLKNANWMFEIPQQLVRNNSSITSAGICFIPYYYPNKGQWFEPVAVSESDGSIVSKQLASASHDYTKKEFYTVPMSTGEAHWCEPYMDRDGSKEAVTTYSVPVLDADSTLVAVVFADISLDWLKDIMNEAKGYKSTHRILTTGRFTHLAGEETPMLRQAIQQIRETGSNEGYFMMNDEEGCKYHVFYTPVGGDTDWVLINCLEDSDVFGGLRKIRLILLLPVMVGLLIVGFIVWRSSRNLERLRKVKAEKDRISGELRVAREIQMSMLPAAHLCLDDVDICGSLMPAREVGGDIYDYFIRDEKLFFCIGDVSGKGAPSALLMTVSHSLFRSTSAHENNPARIMQSINDAASSGNDSNMFITLFIGVLDLPTGRLRYCDAGHDAPFLIEKKPLTVDNLAVQPHLPVGVFEDTRYEVQEVTLHGGCTLFLYTDGLTEAKNKERKQFGLARVKEVLKSHADAESRTIQDVVMEAVEGFVKDAEQSDDLTMLVIRYTPRRFESTLTETLVLQNDIQEVTRFSSFMNAAMEKLGIKMSLARQLRLAVEEAVVNVIDYAYPPGAKGDITVKLLSDGRTLRFQIIDSGVPFDPTEKERADTTLSAEDRQIGGLGILLVRELMDSINYERDDGKNILTLTKSIT